jgi:hypothetical protein
MMLASCALNKAEDKKSSIVELISHYRDNGYNGDFSFTFFSMIGAIGGGRYERKRMCSKECFEFEVYQFDDKNKIKNFLIHENAYSNGYFLIIIHEGNVEHIKQVLYNF